ncbi:beta-hexosaminidase [Candidatus Moduliflexus flocculans]|uniref:beta-N-acetylhexosaminidase n=1 Tax=Candidatus Moduliflexus flocculans TaxID=1499966 RepID=A0A081BPH5_9BACT|nr:beta-hexosaminidase [Candidatus Moduliflexus flocculans]
MALRGCLIIMLPIIPRPLSCVEKRGQFELTPETAIFAASSLQAEGTYFAQQLSAATGLVITMKLTASAAPHHVIRLELTDDCQHLGTEGYRLAIMPDAVKISAAAPAGIFYACQTALQLLPANAPRTLPCAEIEDAPRFRWRGMHLDVCRHFMPKEFIKRCLDLLARYKFNTFHWHLTEDQGWRLEINKHPKLTEIGAWRMENGERYGGFYTQDDAREIVAYAQERHITVLPEIEMPGHAVAALAAYPELSCSGGPFEVATTWGIFQDVYCAGNERVFTLLEDVFSEVFDIFPSQYIHIGGDECPKERWKTCHQCQARIQAEGLRNEEELQSYFIKRIEKFLHANNRRLIGWDEILEGGLAPDATVMSWRGEQGGIEAARQGHDVIMTPQSHCYFDHYQSSDFANEPKAFSLQPPLPLEDVYAYEPIPAELMPEEAAHVLGAQANLWTEYIPTTQQAEYMLLPRLCALSEVVWSPKELRDEANFFSRLPAHFDYFDAMGINYRRLKK